MTTQLHKHITAKAQSFMSCCIRTVCTSATNTLTLGEKTAILSAGSECTVTVGSGVTTSAKAQTANLNTRSVAVTLASASDIAAASGSVASSVHYNTPARHFTIQL